MKSIHKIIFAVIILFTLTLLTGCSKKNITVVNNPELEQSLYGTWSFKTVSQNEIMSDPNTESEKYLGHISVVNTNLISFSQNQNFQMQNSATLDSINLYNDAFISEEEIKQQIEKSVIIQGKFCVDKDYIELKTETVTINNQFTYTAEEYSKIDSSFGSAIQTQKWSLSNNTLSFKDSKGNIIASYSKE